MSLHSSPTAMCRQRAWASESRLQVAHSPADHLAAALPVFAALETRIARHKLLQDWMQLIFGAHAQLKRVDEGDEVLLSGG